MIANKLALRIAAVNDSKGFTRKPSSERVRRGQISFLARPFPNTTITGSAERSTDFARRPNSLTPRDAVSEWISSGKPSWNPTTQIVTRNGVRSGPFPVNQGVNLPAGLMSGATNLTGKLSAWIENSQVQFYTQNATGNRISTGIPTPFTQNSAVRFLESGTFLLRNKGGLFPLYIAPAIKDKSIYDWSSINATAANHSIDTANTYRLEAEHYFLRTPQYVIAAQLLTATAAIMGMPESWLARLGDNITGLSTDGLTDVTSRGYEVEVTYNPTRNWRIKFNVAQQQAIDSNIAPDEINYWTARLPVWSTLKDDNGQLWWTSIATTNLSGSVNNYAYRIIDPRQIILSTSFDL